MTDNTTPKLSALVITYNEEIHMSELLTNLSFADEIIIVDSFSTDRTKEISLTFPKVKFIENRFENYAAQRNFAIDQAKNDWILFIDADERLTPKLQKEVIDTISENPKHSAYMVYRIFMFKNKVLRFSGRQTDRIIRLFNKQKVRYTMERLVHEKISIEGSTGTMKHKIVHYCYSDYNVYKGKMIQYGKLKALEDQKKGLKPNLFHFYIKPAYNFLHLYLIRLGILDGKKGIIICSINAQSVYARFLELKRLNQMNQTT